MVAEAARLAGWRVVGVSVAGTSHAVTMTRCQDFSAYAVVRDARGDDVLLAAVADGAGSASASHHGARTAVEAALAALRAHAEAGDVGEAQVRDAIQSARERVLEVAVEYEHAAREYASTLLVAVALPDATIAAQIGDGAIVVDDGALRPATWPEQGEYANSTCFLVDDDALDHVQCVTVGPARRLALFSDGLQALALEYDARAAHAPFFAPFFGYVETSEKPDDLIEAELRSYLESGSVNARTDDDKSLVLAVRR